MKEGLKKAISALDKYFDAHEKIHCHSKDWGIVRKELPEIPEEEKGPTDTEYKEAFDEGREGIAELENPPITMRRDK